MSGVFTVSLDFELYWGVRDKRSIEQYKTNLLGVRQAVPGMLKLFKEYGVHTTWATVGLLFFENKKELLGGLPALQPQYDNANLSPYGWIPQIGDNEKSDPFHYGYSLIEEIRQTPFQEIGCHTFSHYYCLERGQTTQTFRADMEAAIAIAEKRGIKLESLVFPRNQFNENYLSVCAELGFKTYRGNERSWLYRARNREDETLLRRAFRLADTYINVSSHNTHRLPTAGESLPIDLPSSRFLRPFSRKLAPLDGLRFQRIAQDLTYAAQKGELFHLWWHPHNFGANTGQNLDFLEKILKHYRFLQEKYAMRSLTMGELAAERQPKS